MTYSVLIAAPFLIAAIVLAVRFVGCTEDFDQFDPDGGDGNGEGEGRKHHAVGKLGGSGKLSGQAAFASQDPNTQTDQFTTQGTYTYDIPWWCTVIDVLLLGAGGGGSGGVPLGNGGGAGSWATVILWRGLGERPPGAVEFPPTTTSVSIAVGSGGSAGSANTAPTPGGDSTATATGMSQLTAPGGAGGVNPDATGTGPPSQTVDGTTESGGADQTNPNAVGNAPGGGGAGGFINGATGADGAAWIVARQT